MNHYQLVDINQYLWEMTKANVCLDWSNPKYGTFMNFLKNQGAGSITKKQPNKSMDTQTKSTIIDRSNFGLRGEKKISLFEESEQLDDIIKCKINELSSKITEKNVEQIMKEFQLLQFEKVEDITKISKCLHRCIIVSANYGSQMTSLLNYLIQNYPQYQSEMQKQFHCYSETQFHHLNQLNEADLNTLETAFMLKKDIITNYQLMVMNFTKGKLFSDSVTNDIISNLLKAGNSNGIELLIRFLIHLKTQKLPFPPTLINTISNLIQSEKYPKRLDILLMDLE